MRSSVDAKMRWFFRGRLREVYGGSPFLSAARRFFFVSVRLVVVLVLLCFRRREFSFGLPSLSRCVDGQ